MRGEWIEILSSGLVSSVTCLSPCGESGLKWRWELALDHRGLCLSPCGESGLKYFSNQLFASLIRLSPCGESGLKCAQEVVDRGLGVSPHAGRVD